jgi:hypothetical protein
LDLECHEKVARKSIWLLDTYVISVSTFAIATIIKLFSINADFSQNHLLAMSKVLEICLVLLLTAYTKSLAVRCALVMQNITCHFFSPLQL